MGTGRDSLETDENVVTCFIDGAATLKRARKQGLLRPVAPRPLNARVARRRRRFRTTSIAVARAGPPVTGRSSLRDPSESIPDDLDPVARRLQFDFVLMLCRRLGVKDVFLFATEAGAPAWLTLGFEHVGSSASLIHLRFDLLFKRDRGVLARSARGPRRRASAARWTALKIFSDSAGLYPMAAPPAPAPRRRAAASKRVVDDADADDEDEAWEPGRPSMMDLDDDEQEQAAKAKRKLKRRSKKSAKAKNAAGAAPHAPVSAPPAAPPRRPSPRRRSRQRRRSRDEGWEESDEDDPVEDLIHRERIRERDLLRTPGCLALGRKAFRLEDMPRVTERDREILRRVLYILREAERRLQRLFPNLDFRLSWSVRFNVVVQTIDAIALDSNLELTRVDMEVRRSTVGVYEDSLACQLLGQTYYVHPDKTIKITVDLVVTSEVIGALDNGHLIVELKYLQAMHVKNRMLKKCCYTLYLLELADRLRGEASRETLKTARKNVVELDMALLAPDAAGVIRKFANAIARKAAEARGETFVPTPYDETAVDAVVVTAVPPVAPVVAAPAGPPLKALEAMTAKECNAELDAAGVPKKGRSVANTTIGILRDLVRRLRAGEPAASLTVPRKPKSAEELFVIDKAEQLACRARTRRPSTSIFRARTLFSSQATLVADGAKKVVFSTGAKNANGTDYLKARFRGLGETDPLRLEFEELARRGVAAAAADELPVDRLQRVPDPGLVNLPTIWPRMRFPSAS
ncbi:hypothetical protein JL720_7208 [Aureococcus anophagefferens]|nr:hypothetical protein JL720_7208 [Aureococcus anophagefferens]